MRGLFPMLGVGRAQLAGLHRECDQARREGQQDERILEPVANGSHLDSSVTKIPGMCLRKKGRIHPMARLCRCLANAGGE
jgi:hypothetical protein